MPIQKPVQRLRRGESPQPEDREKTAVVAAAAQVEARSEHQELLAHWDLESGDRGRE